MVTAAEAAETLEELLAELNRRRRDVDELSDAYDGKHRLRFLSEDFRQYHADRYNDFTDNWCSIVADAPHERLEITGIRLPGQRDGDDGLFADWRATDSDALSDLAFLDAIIAKRAFALVWADADEQPIVTWEHPSQAIVGYDPETRARKAGAKVWSDDDNEYATLYLPTEIWKFQRPRAQSLRVLAVTAEQIPTTPLLAGAWDLRAEGVIPNPLGKVPLVEFANRPRLAREPHSDIAGALAIQHAINMLWSQLFAVSDEATLGVRGVIGAEMPMRPILNEDGDVTGEEPIDLRQWRKGKVAWIEDAGAQTFEFSTAKLDAFTEVVEILVGHLAAQTRTPAHYLLIGGTMANISADAMKALETGLVERTREKTQHFGRAARDVFELLALVRNDARKAAAVRGAVTLWRDIENRSDAQVADAALKDRQIGLPLRYILERRYNLSPAEIDRVIAMRDTEAADPFLQQVLGGALDGPTGAAGGSAAVGQ
ncbi:phage portal protein [Nocardioides sp.]|uniref:phage portal protein n=1 Tax=Nocardioides sp. TaxID=35761 RepID=UPI0035173FF2